MSGANLVVFLLGATAFGMSYTLSQYGQGVLGWSPLRFGLANVVMPLGAVVGSYAGQALVTRVGARPVAVGGLTLCAFAALLLSGVPVDGGFLRDLLPALLLFGPGVGACAVAGSIAALTGVGERDSGSPPASRRPRSRSAGPSGSPSSPPRACRTPSAPSGSRP